MINWIKKIFRIKTVVPESTGVVNWNNSGTYIIYSKIGLVKLSPRDLKFIIKTFN